MTRRRRPLEGRRVSLTGEEIAAIRWFIADGPNWFEDDEPFEPFLRRSIARSLHRKGLIDDATMKTIDGTYQRGTDTALFPVDQDYECRRDCSRARLDAAHYLTESTSQLKRWSGVDLSTYPDRTAGVR